MSLATRNAFLNLFFNGTAYTPPSNRYIALFVGDPDGSGSEVSANNYARVVCNSWAAASGGSISNSALAQFPIPSGAWGTVTHFAIFDALTGGTMRWSGSLTSVQSVGVNNNPSFPAGSFVATMPSMSVTLANALLNLFFRGTSYTPPAHHYVGIYVGDPNGAGSEVSGNAYTRILHDSWTTATAGTLVNDGVIQFPIPTGSWGTVTHFAIFDVATGGTPLWPGALNAVQSIGENNDVEWADAALTGALAA